MVAMQYCKANGIGPAPSRQQGKVAVDDAERKVSNGILPNYDAKINKYTKPAIKGPSGRQSCQLGPVTDRVDWQAYFFAHLQDRKISFVMRRLGLGHNGFY